MHRLVPQSIYTFKIIASQVQNPAVVLIKFYMDSDCLVVVLSTQAYILPTQEGFVLEIEPIKDLT